MCYTVTHMTTHILYHCIHIPPHYIHILFRCIHVPTHIMPPILLYTLTTTHTFPPPHSWREACCFNQHITNCFNVSQPTSFVVPCAQLFNVSTTCPRAVQCMCVLCVFGVCFFCVGRVWVFHGCIWWAYSVFPTREGCCMVVMLHDKPTIAFAFLPHTHTYTPTHCTKHHPHTPNSTHTHQTHLFLFAPLHTAPRLNPPTPTHTHQSHTCPLAHPHSIGFLRQHGGYSRRLHSGWGCLFTYSSARRVCYVAA